MSIDSEVSEATTLSSALGFSPAVVELGHTHPSVRRVLSAAGGTMSFLVSLDDDQITDLEVEIGIGHRGFEKEAESSSWSRALPYVGRLGHASGLIAEVGYCLAVEKMAGVALPDRAIWLRMLASEIARITDHFARLGALAMSIGLASGTSAAQHGEQHAAELLQLITGERGFGGWIQLGGVRSSLPQDFELRWSLAQASIGAALGKFEAVTLRNPSCQKRLRGVAPWSAEQCLAWGVTGPSMRAAGMAADLRRDKPYLAYGSVDFAIPTGENGDDVDRLLVVVREIGESLRIADQCQQLIASWGPGALRSAEPGFCERPDSDPSDLSGAGEADLEGPNLPFGEVVSSVESSTGELGFFLVSDGEGLPRRIRCRGPSFFHAQALQPMLLGARLDDLLPTAALLHLVSGECDR